MLILIVNFMFIIHFIFIHIFFIYYYFILHIFVMKILISMLLSKVFYYYKYNLIKLKNIEQNFFSTEIFNQNILYFYFISLCNP